jgi:hypothetical protein
MVFFFALQVRVNRLEKFRYRPPQKCDHFTSQVFRNSQPIIDTFQYPPSGCSVHVRDGEECGLCVCGIVEVRRWVMVGSVSWSSQG